MSFFRIIFLVYPLLDIYIGYHLFAFLRACTPERHITALTVIPLVLFVLASLTPILPGKLPESFPGRRFLLKTGNIFMAVFVFGLMASVLFDFFALVYRIASKAPLSAHRPVIFIAGLLCILGAVCAIVLGDLHRNDTRVHRYSIDIAKDGGSAGTLRIALFSDTHLGLNTGERQIAQLVKKVNAESPDIVLIAGDIFDNAFSNVKDPEKIADLLASLESPLGTFAVFGNHDVDRDLTASSAPESTAYETFLSRADIRVLEDECLTLSDSFILAGRKDKSRSRSAGGRLSASALLSGLPEDMPVIVLDHQPYEYSELAAAGADIDLSGHTHNGQFFPGNLIVSRMYENGWGYKVCHGMHTFTTSGAGLWGPPVRIGTDSEIMVIDVHFTGTAKD